MVKRNKKNADYSDKAIVSILVIALMLSLASIIVTVSQFKSDQEMITGRAVNDSGIASITITGATSITNQIQTIAFGTGYVNASCGSCTMDSAYGFYPGNESCCTTFNNVTEGFLLENTGNKNVSVNYSCTGSCTGATFIGGSGTFKLNTSDNLARQLDNETSALDTVASCGGNLNITTYTDVSAVGDWLCGNGSNYWLDYTGTEDAFSVDLYVYLPADAPSNTIQTATFEFGATSSG